MSQSQGSDTRHIESTISTNTRGPSDAGTNITGQSVAGTAGSERTAAEVNGVTNMNGVAGSGMSVNGGGGGVLSETLIRQRERSPGPHLEEMASSIEEEGGFIRVNGASHDAGVGEGEDSGSVLSSSQDSNDGDQDVSSDGFDPDLRRVKVRTTLHVQNTPNSHFLLPCPVFLSFARGTMEIVISFFLPFHKPNLRDYVVAPSYASLSTHMTTLTRSCSSDQTR